MHKRQWIRLGHCIMLVATVATAAMGVASLWLTVSVQCNTPIQTNGSVVLVERQIGVGLTGCTFYISRRSAGVEYFSVHSGSWQRDLPANSWLRIRTHEARTSMWWPWGNWRDARWIVIPLWIPLALFGLCTIWLWRRSRSRPGYCSKCGYDLAGIVSVVCPECGRPFLSSR